MNEMRTIALTGSPMVLVPVAYGMLELVPLQMRLPLFVAIPLIAALVCYGVSYLLSKESDPTESMLSVGVYGLGFLVVGLGPLLVVRRRWDGSVPDTFMVNAAGILLIAGLMTTVLYIVMACYLAWRNNRSAPKGTTKK